MTMPTFVFSWSLVQIRDLEPHTSYGICLQAITIDQTYGEISNVVIVQPGK